MAEKIQRRRSTADNGEPDFRNDRAPKIEELEAGLEIDEHALEESLQNQPAMFYEVAKALALFVSRRDAAKQNLQTVEAEVDIEIRREAVTNDDKVTEREVESRKRAHRDVQAANDELMTLNHSVGQYGALKEAFLQRGYALKDIVALYIANYYSDSSADSARRGMRDRNADTVRQNRREMNR